MNSRKNGPQHRQRQSSKAKRWWGVQINNQLAKLIIGVGSLCVFALSQLLDLTQEAFWWLFISFGVVVILGLAIANHFTDREKPKTSKPK